MKLYNLLFAFVFILALCSLTQATTNAYSYCYQETTNASTTSDGICSLNYTGGYAITGDISGAPLMYDGSYVTYAGTTPPSNLGSFYINYSVPPGASKFGNKVRIAWGNNGALLNDSNYTLPNDSIYNNQVLLNITINSATAFNAFTTASYFNGTVYKPIPNYYHPPQVFVAVIFDEAIIWNASVFVENNITYNPVTYETTNEAYYYNFTAPNVLSAQATLNYNGKSYPSTVSCNLANCTAINTFDVPTITVPSQNNSFYWTVSVYNGKTVTYINSTISNQTVNSINMSYCTSGNTTLNFTSWDEQNKTRINPFSFDGSFNYYLGSGTTYKTVNYTNSNVANVAFCITPNIQYYTDAIIAYSAPANPNSYILRNYFYQRHGINGTTQQVPLNLLKSSASTSFILQVEDGMLLPVKGVLVEAIRCYPGTNSQETSFISRTDSNGLTTGNFEAETALYKFNITNYSQSLLYIDNCAQVVPQTAPYTLLFQLGTGYTSAFLNLDNATNIQYSMNYNKTAHTFTVSYIDTSSNFLGATLLVTPINQTGNTEVATCMQNSSLQSGILTCNATDPGYFYSNLVITRSNGNYVTQQTFAVSTPGMGYLGVFLGWLIILVCAFTFKFNEIAGIWLVNVAIVFVNILGLIDFGIPFITASLMLGVILTVIIER